VELSRRRAAREQAFREIDSLLQLCHPRLLGLELAETLAHFLEPSLVHLLGLASADAPANGHADRPEQESEADEAVGQVHCKLAEFRHQLCSGPGSIAARASALVVIPTARTTPAPHTFVAITRRRASTIIAAPRSPNVPGSGTTGADALPYTQPSHAPPVTTRSLAPTIDDTHGEAASAFVQ
jgi:hypothetical protein